MRFSNHPDWAPIPWQLCPILWPVRCMIYESSPWARNSVFRQRIGFVSADCLSLIQTFLMEDKTLLLTLYTELNNRSYSGSISGPTFMHQEMS